MDQHARGAEGAGKGVRKHGATSRKLLYEISTMLLSDYQYGSLPGQYYGLLCCHKCYLSVQHLLLRSLLVANLVEENVNKQGLPALGTAHRASLMHCVSSTAHGKQHPTCSRLQMPSLASCQARARHSVMAAPDRCNETAQGEKPSGSRVCKQGVRGF